MDFHFILRLRAQNSARLGCEGAGLGAKLCEAEVRRARNNGIEELLEKCILFVEIAACSGYGSVIR